MNLGTIQDHLSHRDLKHARHTLLVVRANITTPDFLLCIIRRA